MSGYNSIDTTKWEMIQVRISPEQKDKIKSWCFLHRINVSTATRLLWENLLAWEQVELPKEAPGLNKIDWTMQRINNFFKKGSNSNGFYR